MKKKQVTMRRIVSSLLSMGMVLSLVPVSGTTSMAAETNEVVESIGTPESMGTSEDTETLESTEATAGTETPEDAEQEIVEKYYHVGGVSIDLDKDFEEPYCKAWLWDAESKTLTFRKTMQITSNTDTIGYSVYGVGNGMHLVNMDHKENDNYTLVGMGLPDGTTIKLEDGVCVYANSHLSDAVYCEGKLTIRGNGALCAKGATFGVSSVLPGYDNDDEQTGSGISCHGGLTIGNELANEKTTVDVNSFFNYKFGLFVSSDKEGQEDLINIESGQLLMGTLEVTEDGSKKTVYAQINCGGKEKRVVLNPENPASLLYINTVKGEDDKDTSSQNGAIVDEETGILTTDTATIVYGEDGTYYYQNYHSQAGEYYMIETMSENTSETASGIGDLLVNRFLVKDDEPFKLNKEWLVEVAVTDDTKKFIGWNTEKNATVALAEDAIELTDIDENTKFKTQQLYAVYGDREKIEKAPSPKYTVNPNLLTNLEAGAEYEITYTDAAGEIKSEQVTISESGQTEIKNDWYGQNISVVKRGNGTTTYDSVEIIVPIVDKAETPVIGVDYVTEKFTGIDEDSNYTIYVNGESESHKLGKGFDVAEYFGNKVAFTRSSDEANGVPSELSNELELASRPATPVKGTDFVVKDVVYDGTVDVTDAKAVIDFADDAVEYEVKIGDSEWSKVKDSVSVEPNTTVMLRIPAVADKHPASEIVDASADVIREVMTGEANIDFANEMLKDLTPETKYNITIPVTGRVVPLTADKNGKVKLAGVDNKDASYDLVGKTISVAKAGTVDGVADSVGVTKNIDKRPAAPAVDTEYTITEAVDGVNEGKVTITIDAKATAVYEYRIDGEWTDIAAGATITAAPNETVRIRKKSTNETFASEFAEVVPENAKEATPKAVVTYIQESLTGLVADAAYEITPEGGKKVTLRADANGAIAVEGMDADGKAYSLLGTTVSVVKVGGENKRNSNPQEGLVIATRPAAPVSDQENEKKDFGVGASSNKNEGKATVTINDSTISYEYQAGDAIGGTEWTKVENGAFAVAAETKVVLRKSATEKAFASEGTEFVTSAVKAVPSAKIDYKEEKLTDLMAYGTYELTLADGAKVVIPADKDGKIAFEGKDGSDKEYSLLGATLSIVKMATESVEASDPQEGLVIAARPVAPTAEEVGKTVSAEGTTFTVDSNYIYRVGIGEWKTVAEKETVVAEAGKEVQIKKVANEAAPASASLIFTATKKEVTPDKAVINFLYSTVTGLERDKEYVITVAGKTMEPVKADVSGAIVIDLGGSKEGDEIAVVRKADATNHTEDSDAKVITVPAKQAKPENASFAVEYQGTESEMTIYTPAGCEYFDAETKEWVSIETVGEGDKEKGELKVAGGSAVEVRVAATATAPASDSVKIVIEATPKATVDYLNSTLKNLEEGTYVVTTGDAKEVATGEVKDGKLAVKELSNYYGNELFVVKKGTAGTTYDSVPQKIPVADSSTVTAPSKNQFKVTNGPKDSVISGITKNQEYSTDNGKTWISGDDKDVTVPAGSVVLIRDKAKESKPASGAVSIVTEVAKSEKTAEVTPNAVVDYITGKLTGLASGADYEVTVAGKITAIKADAEGKTDASGYYGQIISIVKKGDNVTTTDSAPQQLAVAAKVAAPDKNQFVIETPSTGETSGNIIIKNITSDYEYSTDNGVAWTTGDGNDVVVPAGTVVLIRKKATAISPASESVSIAATTYQSLSAIEQTILTANTDKNDPAGSTFAELCLKAEGKNKSVKLSWKKVADADGYIVYGAACGDKMKKIETVKTASTTKLTQKKLKAGKYYKYIVAAYKTMNGQDYVIATSKSAHVTTLGGKKGNPTKVSVKASKVNIKKGKKSTIKASYKSSKTVQVHIAKLRYESSDAKVATVTKKGVIEGKTKGKATIYIYAQNGIYNTVKVTVK